MIRSRMLIVHACFSGALLALLTACSHSNLRPADPSSDFAIFIPPGATGYELPRNEKIVLGEPSAQRNAIYPVALVARKLPERDVCLELEINEQGMVYLSRPLYGVPGCPTSAAAVEPEFVAAAQAAVSNWRFKPAQLCHFGAGVDAKTMGNDCAREGASIEPLAIKLAFVFSFRLADGVPTSQTRSFQ